MVKMMKFKIIEELHSGGEGETFSFSTRDESESWFVGYGGGREHVRQGRLEFPGEPVGYVDINPEHGEAT